MSLPTSRADEGRGRPREARAGPPSEPRGGPPAEGIARAKPPPRPSRGLSARGGRARNGAARLLLALVAALVALGLPGGVLDRGVPLPAWIVDSEGSLGAIDGPGVGVARAASPSPSPPAGDPRSPGRGPGFVGEPLLAIGLVLAVGLVAALITFAYARLAPTEDERPRHRSGR